MLLQNNLKIGNLPVSEFFQCLILKDQCRVVSVYTDAWVGALSWLSQAQCPVGSHKSKHFQSWYCTCYKFPKQSCQLIKIIVLIDWLKTNSWIDNTDFIITNKYITQILQ